MKVLLADTDHDRRDVVHVALESRGMCVRAAREPRDATLALVEEGPFDVLVVGAGMIGTGAVDLLDVVVSRASGLRVVSLVPVGHRSTRWLQIEEIGLPTSDALYRSIASRPR